MLNSMNDYIQAGNLLFNTCYVLGMMLCSKDTVEIGNMGMILILAVSYLKMFNGLFKSTSFNSFSALKGTLTMIKHHIYFI